MYLAVLYDIEKLLTSNVSISNIATVARKGFNAKFAAKVDFLIWIYVIISNADIRSLKTFHTLFHFFMHPCHTVRNVLDVITYEWLETTKSMVIYFLRYRLRY